MRDLPVLLSGYRCTVVDPAIPRKRGDLRLTDLVLGRFFEPGSSGGFKGRRPQRGVNAGRRPPAGLGVDAGEDGATLGSRKRGDHAACSGGSSRVMRLRS